MDFLDGTPILDIKPYLPYADSIPRAKAGWAEEELSEPSQGSPSPPVVEFSPEAERFCETEGARAGIPSLRELIRQILRQDPRPAAQRNLEIAEYAFRLCDLDVHWEARDGKFRVTRILFP